MGLMSGRNRKGGEASCLVMDVTSFSVRESVRRECGVDIVFAWRDILS